MRARITQDVKDAMKAKDERKLSTLRMVNSALKNADIDARGQGKPPLSDEDLLGLLQKMIKQRQESVALYDKGGRPELAAQEREEIAVISAYLPKQMSDDEVNAAIAAIVTETGAAGFAIERTWASSMSERMMRAAASSRDCVSSAKSGTTITMITLITVNVMSRSISVNARLGRLTTPPADGRPRPPKLRPTRSCTRRGRSAAWASRWVWAPGGDRR